VVEKTRPGGTSYAGSDFAGPFTSQFQAQMSMQFCAAATLLGRPVKSLSFFAEQFDDPEVAELAAKVELACEEGRTKPRFEVYTSDGRVLAAEEETVDQGPRAPSWENVEHKFKELAVDFLGEKKMGQIIALVNDLEKIKNLRELTRLL
jgi:2-methylcitrate dehydratase PrpD